MESFYEALGGSGTVGDADEAGDDLEYELNMDRTVELYRFFLENHFRELIFFLESPMPREKYKLLPSPNAHYEKRCSVRLNNLTKCIYPFLKTQWTLLF